jgi:F-type H+-transporting ATPase subunit gamma
MAKTREIRRRIRSIRNTMQLTRAMKMVAAAKLRRSQDRIVRARPYARRMAEVLQSLAARANPQEHPLLRVRPERRVDVVVVGADRGLCGSFNTAVFKTAVVHLGALYGAELSVLAVGKKSRDYFRRRPFAIRHEWPDVFRNLDYATAADITGGLVERYTAEEIDAVYLVYNEFKSAIQQRPVVERLLPVEPAGAPPGETADEYIHEPDARTLYAQLLPKHLEVQVYRALLESNAAEQAARMTAMDSATNNAGEIIDALTLHMNRVRQASITTEIIEVVSGAEALG